MQVSPEAGDSDVNHIGETGNILAINQITFLHLINAWGPGLTHRDNPGRSGAVVWKVEIGKKYVQGSSRGGHLQYVVIRLSRRMPSINQSACQILFPFWGPRLAPALAEWIPTLP